MKTYDQNFKELYQSNKEIKNNELQQAVENQLLINQSTNLTVLSNLSNQKSQIN